MNKARYDLSSTTHEICRVFDLSFVEQEIKSELDSLSEIEVVSDRDLRSIVIRNLINNAIKFTLQGGSISIKLQEQQLEEVFSITDIGVGIDQENIDQFSSDDFIAFSNDMEGEKGTGLGLILCREYVVLHGGKFSVTSEKGKGSTFTFIIPIGK